MEVAVIIVTYNTTKNNWIGKCLNSINSSSIPLNTIIIDNASTDNTVDIIKNNYPNVDLTESKENLGFAKANNLGIKLAYKSGADYIFLLNHDAWVEPNTIKTLIEIHQENPQYGIVSPIHLNGAGDNLDLNFYKYLGNIEKAGRLLMTDLIKKKPLRDIYEMKFVNAAAWMISRECIEKVGDFDDILFQHYGEDNNYLQRMFYHGFKLGVVPNCFVFHDREDRKGTKTKDTFNPDKAILKFKRYGSSMTFEGAHLYMETQIKNDLKSAIKYFLSLQFSKSIYYYKLHKEKNTLKELIIMRRKRYIEL